MFLVVVVYVRPMLFFSEKFGQCSLQSTSRLRLCYHFFLMVETKLRLLNARYTGKLQITLKCKLYYLITKTIHEKQSLVHFPWAQACQQLKLTTDIGREI